MTSDSSVDTETLATVTVTFNPDLALLETQLRSLPPACVKLVVDNASRSELQERLDAVADRVKNVQLLRNSKNVGLAAAVNRGVHAIADLPKRPRFVLLLDQDSEPWQGSVGALVDAFLELDAEHGDVGCVGPSLRDPVTGLAYGFHQCTRWRWRRVFPPSGSTIPVPCANLNGSGSLVPTSLFERLGGLDESFFIDHVDTEWAFRILASGYTLWGVPNAVFDHRMGQSSTRFWFFGWRVWPQRCPKRHFYLFRNAVTLVRRDYVPNVWKAWAVLKLLMTAGVCTFHGPRRREQLCQMWAGVRSGMHRSDMREH